MKKENTKEYINIPKKKGFIYRGMSYQEFANAKRNNYFRSSSSILGTYASDDPYTAECYAEYLAPKGRISLPTRPTYVVAFSKKSLDIVCSENINSFIKFCKKLKIITLQHPILYWQSLFKKYVSGDDQIIVGKIPFSKAKEIYKFSRGKWIRIK